MFKTKKSSIDLSSARKILLIRLRRIGDNIMTSPAVAVLKENIPQASLTYIVEELSREVVEGNPHLDEIIVIPRKLKTRDFIKLILRVRRERYDILIDFFGGPKAAWLTLFSKARFKVGYAVKYKSIIYHVRIPRRPPEGRVHSVVNHVNLVRSLGIDISSLPPLQVPQARVEEKGRIERYITRNDLEESGFITIHVEAGNVFRDWGADKIIDLIGLLTRKHSRKIVLVGASKDRRRAGEIITKSGIPLYSTVGELGLRELRELISRSVLFIGPDSGPMHLAASTGTPIVAYFGPTLPILFKPWQAESVILEKDFECRETCRQKKCISKDYRCLQSITPEEVYTACLKFLE